MSRARSFLLLLNGELPTADEFDVWEREITLHTFIHENVRKRFLEGFHYDAHPMGMLVSAVAALSTFYLDAKDIFDPESRDKQIIRLIAKMPTLAAAAPLPVCRNAHSATSPPPPPPCGTRSCHAIAPPILCFIPSRKDNLAPPPPCARGSRHVIAPPILCSPRHKPADKATPPLPTLRNKIMPARGPRRLLCVVVVTMSA